MKWIKKLGLLACSCLLCVLALELGLRLFSRGGTIIRWPVPDARYGFMNRKNFQQTVTYPHTSAVWRVRINSLGLRGPELPPARAGELRVLTMGDSFTFGYGVNEEATFGALLSERLRVAGWTNVWINAAAAGWGTLQQVKFVQDHYDRFRPDVVVLTFCGNDHIDDEVFAAGAAGGLLPSFPGKRWLRDHSRLYGLVYEALYSRLFSGRLHEHNPRLEDAPVAPAPAGGAADGAVSAELDRRWRGTEEKLRAFVAWLEERRPGTVLFLQAADFWVADINTHLARLADGVKIVYVAPPAAALQRPHAEVVLGFDPHWNEWTHERVAEQLFHSVTGRLGRTGP